MQKVTKSINGVEYTTVDSNNSCRDCVASGSSSLCPRLADKGCHSEYIFVPLTNTDKPVLETEGVKYDSDKTQYSLVPPYALEAVAKNLTAGLKKYPHRNNWQLVDNAEERYLDALYRHLEEHRKGNIYDTDNVDPTTTHLSAVAVNAMFLLELMLNPTLEKTNEHTN